MKDDIRRKRSKKHYNYRKEVLIFNLVGFSFVIMFAVFGALNIFTGKKALRNEAVEQYKAGNYEEAIDLFDKAIDKKQWFSDSMNVDMEMYKANSYIMLNNYSSAMNIYVQIEEEYSESYYDKEEVDFLIRLTNALDKYDKGDYVSVIAAFSDGVDKGYTQLCLYLADCYDHQADFESMKKYCDLYASRYELNPYLCYKYASYYILNDNYEQAINYINQGIAISDGDVKQALCYAEIMCYEKLCNYEKAYSLAQNYKINYPQDMQGQNIIDYLDTRVNIDTTTVNNYFE